LNTNCIEAIELLKLMRNTLKLYITKLSTFGRIWRAFKKMARAVLAQKKGTSYRYIKSLIAMW
jgi:hypothetical protein